MGNSFKFNTIKLSFLKNNIIRFENCPNNNFSNKPSLNIAHKVFDNNEYKIVENGNEVIIYYDDLLIKFDTNDVYKTLTFYLNNEIVYKYKSVKTNGELPNVKKTPFAFAIMDSPRLILNSTGYDTEGDGFDLQNEVKDLFILICKNDFKLLRRQYISLTGYNEIPRFKNFGFWSSKDLVDKTEKPSLTIKEYNKNKIPLDNIVLGNVWKDENSNYEFDKTLAKDPESLITTLHKKGVEVAFIDEPKDLSKKSNILNANDINFRVNGTSSYLTRGLDSWQVNCDGNTKLKKLTRKLPSNILANYAYSDITKNFYESFVLDKEVHIRPVTISNLSAIINGVYKKIASPREHTYTIQLGGKIPFDMPTLNNEVSNLLRCSNNMVGYYASDIGGYTGKIKPRELIRWYEFGVFSPIFKPYYLDTIENRRDPWLFDKASATTLKDYIYLRYHILNVFTTASFRHYYDGLGISRPLSFVFPNDRKTYKVDNSFMLGDNILVSPITGNKKEKVSRKHYIEPVVVTYFKGDYANREKIRKEKTDTIDFETKGERIARGITKLYTASFVTRIQFKHIVDLHLNVKGGIRFYIDDDLVIDNIKPDFEFNGIIARLNALQKYKIKIVFTNRTNTNSFVHLFYSQLTIHDKHKVYLPEGEWFDVFHRGVYLGNRSISKKYHIEETPVFVRAGALIPLYSDVSNISKMSLKESIYDYYPSRNRINDDYFIEDDGITTAYQVGVYRKNNYHTYYNEKENCYVVKLDKSENSIDDGLTLRKIVLKMHVKKGEFVKKVEINGEDTRFFRHEHKKGVMPFSDKKFACDSKTCIVRFKQNIKSDYVIKLFLR